MPQRLAVLFVCLLAPLCAQRKVDLRNTHHRVLCVVPIVGKGTIDDPRRPMFAPARLSPRKRTGILAFTWEPADDGKNAIVEFVLSDPAALPELAQQARSQKFDKGNSRKEDVENEFRKHKKDFSLDHFGVAAQ